MGLLAALIINKITANNKIKLDAAIGIVTTAMFALGVAIVSKMRNFKQNFEAVLFGNILGITDQDLMIIALVAAITLITMFLATAHCSSPHSIVKRHRYPASRPHRFNCYFPCY